MSISSVVSPFCAVLFGLSGVSFSSEGGWDHASGSADRIVGRGAGGAGEVVARQEYAGAAGVAGEDCVGRSRGAREQGHCTRSGLQA